MFDTFVFTERRRNGSPRRKLVSPPRLSQTESKKSYLRVRGEELNGTLENKVREELGSFVLRRDRYKMCLPLSLSRTPAEDGTLESRGSTERFSTWHGGRGWDYVKSFNYTFRGKVRDPCTSPSTTTDTSF